MKTNPDVMEEGTELVDKVAEAVLYEGYILYPYRASSRKNRERFTFGRVYPEDYSVAQEGAEPCVMQTECLVDGIEAGATLRGRARFLQPMAREVWKASPSGKMLNVSPELQIGDRTYQTWHEAVEREIALPEIRLDEKGARNIDFYFPGTQADEEIPDEDGEIGGVIRRRQSTLSGEIEVAVNPVDDETVKVTVRILNKTPMAPQETADQDAVLMCTLASTHTILHAHGAQFVSLTEPGEHALAATSCENIGTWPVLVGDQQRGQRDTVLSSPIILYDYPQIAPESAGNLYDGLEIDEILSLRVKTMTDDEKAEMRSVDEHARRLLERTEALGKEDFLRMHGTMREMDASGDFWDEKTRLDSVTVQGVTLHAGDRVRIKPRNRADAIDMMLAGKTGLIEAIEQDAEERVHLGLVMDDDPGRDLGMMRQPGHRFFYMVDEVEPLKEGE